MQALEEKNIMGRKMSILDWGSGKYKTTAVKEKHRRSDTW